MAAPVASPARSPWAAAFERHASSAAHAPGAAGARGWLDALRREAFEAFVEAGLPTSRHEDWLHTHLGPVERAGFAPAPLAAAPTGCAALDPLERALPAAVRLLFVDGRLVPAPTPRALPAGLSVRPLAEALRECAADLRPLLEQAAAEVHPLARLNTAFLGQGAVVEVRAGAEIAVPVLIEHISTKDVGPLANHLRVIVNAGAQSRVRVFESYVGLGAAADFTNALTQIATGEGAKVQHVRIEREGPGAFHASLLRARLARDASLEALTLVLGAAHARVETDVRLEGPGSSCRADALFLVDGARSADLVSRVHHLTPQATSRQLVKGVLDGESRGAFAGRVLVLPGADGTDARQACHSLLLSPRAQVDARPQLEIDADDVKCSHGATTGRLDPTALFYLRSRGLDEAEARHLLVHAFAGEVLASLGSDPTRPALDAMLSAALHEARSPGRAP
jgi:Fe-S cluster assembly protein SufD